MAKRKKVLVTGGLGFIGSNLTLRCLEEGWDVTVMDVADNLLRVRDYMNKFPDRLKMRIGYFYGDLRNPLAVNAAVKGQDVVMHLGGQVSHVGGQEDPHGDYLINIGGTVNILEAVKHLNPDALVMYASSRSVYGKQKELPINEDTALPQPIDNYGIGKLSCEHYLRLYNYHYGTRTVCFRQANVVGERQQLNTRSYQVISWVYRRILLGEPLEFWGDGKQTRDFLNVRDCCKAYITVAKNPEVGIGKTYNLGGLTYCTWNDVFRICGEVLGKKPHIVYQEYPPIRAKLENPHSRLSYQKIKKDYGWEPDFSLADSFEQMHNYFASKPKEVFEEYLKSNLRVGTEDSAFAWV